MTAPRQYLMSVAFALATLAGVGGIMGCGGAGSGAGGRAGSSAGGPLPKADAVDVTYYYLPG